MRRPAWPVAPPRARKFALTHLVSPPCQLCGNWEWLCLWRAFLPQWRSRSSVWRPRRLKSWEMASADCPPATVGVSIAACSLVSWLEPMDRRPPPRPCGRPSTWPSSPAPSSASSAPTSRSPNAASRARSSTLRRTSSTRSARARTSTSFSMPRPRAAKKEGIEVQTHPVEADPAEAILNVAEETERRPDRRRQQGDDRSASLPARQRPQQRLPSRSMQRHHRPHHLRAADRRISASSVARVRSTPRSLRP